MVGTVKTIAKTRNEWKRDKRILPVKFKASFDRTIVNLGKEGGGKLGQLHALGFIMDPLNLHVRIAHWNSLSLNKK